MAWYNGHPDYRGLKFDLSANRAVVIGNGNVAADVTRMLTLSPRELERTDVANHALAALRASRIEEVVVLGRRGPAQAAFTSAELRELGNLDGVDTRVDPDEVELDAVSRRWLAEEGTFTARKNVELLREFAARPSLPDTRRRIELRFLRSPVQIRGSGAVEAVDVRRNEIVRTDDGAQTAQAVDDDVETIECGLVLRSVGYRAVPLPDVPFDELHFVLPNERGRVLTPEGEPLTGVYAVGWIKRGPTGILGTIKRDAEETVRSLVEDLSAGALPQPPNPARAQIDGCLPGASRTSSRSRAGARSTATNSSAGAVSSARASSWHRVRSCWRPRLAPGAPQQLVRDARWRRGLPGAGTRGARSAAAYWPRCARGRRASQGVHFQPAIKGALSTGLDTRSRRRSGAATETRGQAVVDPVLTGRRPAESRFALARQGLRPAPRWLARARP